MQSPKEDVGVIIEEDGRVKDSDLTAWMSDNTFFDAEESSYTASEVDNAVVLNASSIQNDIRVIIMNAKGRPVTGEAFMIEINGAGKYRDTDKDGIIYVDGLTPGEYGIRLTDSGAYTGPGSELVCQVKADIEYKAIKDISYLIKTEADIDAELEDTEVYEAAVDTTGSSSVRTDENARFGIDVSKWNKEIDWEKVKNAGVEYAIIRCGYRGSKSGAIVVDPYFAENMRGAADAGIPVGVYFFTQAVNEVEAVEEASAVLSLIRQYKLTYPVFIDTEGSGGGRADGVEVRMRTKICQAFCETIRSGGYDAGIYAARNWFNKRLDMTGLSLDNYIWLAEYADKPEFTGKYQMWQYSSAGRINGIEGRVDMNLSYISVDGDD
ncbi:MAG: glycoside hydrolase family 25 protein [Lachnospiraceae bacterium]|nr:glycoside hydrolase family 25 protein [Lachnospiraceae bacterium]